MYICILLPGGAALAPGAARLLLRYALRRAGKARWGAAVAETHAGPRGTLLILRPALTACLADYARPFVHKYFMD